MAYCDHGMVGIDISSHQGPDTRTIPVLVEGNARQDAGCTQALPEDVWWPSGGLAFQLSYQGRAVTQEALSKWRRRTVQGKCSSTPDIFTPGLDIRLFTTNCVTAEWRAWTLENDTPHTDISPFAYRCIRAIGGSWTERLHADPALKRLGQSWAGTRSEHALCAGCGLAHPDM